MIHLEGRLLQVFRRGGSGFDSRLVFVEFVSGNNKSGTLAGFLFLRILWFPRINFISAPYKLIRQSPMLYKLSS